MGPRPGAGTCHAVPPVLIAKLSANVATDSVSGLLCEISYYSKDWIGAEEYLRGKFDLHQCPQEDEPKQTSTVTDPAKTKTP